MAKTIVGLFDTFADAQVVVDELVNAGIDRNDISVVSRNQSTTLADPTAPVATDSTLLDEDVTASTTAEAAGAGAVGGTVLGGALGLLIGIGALTIPGIGPVLAAGPLAAALGSAALGAGIGAAAGGLIGALVGAGVPEEEANVYAEGVRRGGTLVTVNASDELADNAYAILQRNNAVDIDTKASSWRDEGWSSFDHTAEPYVDADTTDNKWEESSKVGTAGGAVAGAATGAAMGSVGGPVGTVIGGVAGAAVGAGVGAAGDTAGEALEESREGRTERTVDDVDTRSTYVGGDKEYGNTAKDNWEESSKVGTAGGTVAGAATGAAMGSVAGPIGTVVGGVAGAAVGAGAGAAGDAAGEAAEDARRGDYGTGTGSDVLPDTTPRSGISDDMNYSSPSSTSAEKPLFRNMPDSPDTTAGLPNDGDTAKDNWEESSKVGTAGGTVAGAATGAAMGSVAGPVGTVVGGVAGAAVGAGVGAAGDAAGEAAEDARRGDYGTTTGTGREVLPGTTPSSTLGDDSNYAARSSMIGDTSGDYATRTSTSGDTRVDDYDTKSSIVRDTTGSMSDGDTIKENWEESSKVGTAGGAVAGAATGAVAGSVAGPVGTVIGGVAGAVAGAAAGAAGDTAAEAIKDEHAGEDYDRGTTSTARTAADQPYVSNDATYTAGDKEYGDTAKDNWEESSKVGTAGGAVAGAATGAAVGSAGGPVGTVIGGVAGAAVGAATGAAGDAAGEAAEDHGSWNDYENDFRSDYDTNYASNSDYTWDQYSLAYRYGYDVSVDPRYEGRDWDEIESTLHGGWDESVYGPWDRFKDAVHRGWERTKHALS